ncbi:Peroxisomal 2 [Diplonema papillatum]|nr:Peroxisomal 2 [Diplonema papillatum]|eukprot:gene3426-5361_t
MSMAPLPKPPVAAVASTEVFRADLMKGKVVFVTGGGSGIGLGICKTFAAHGAKVALCGRTLAKLKAAEGEIRGAGAADVFYDTCDVRDYDRCAAVAAAIGERWGQIDVLVNCAAGNFMCLAEDMSSKAFQTVIDIDLRGTFHMSKACLPWLSRASNGACVVNITATLQYTACPFQAHAASAKAGIDVLTATLGTEWAEYGVRVVGIAPGPVAGTEGGPTGRVFGNMQIQKNPQLVCPVGRFGEKADIANTALFLASPAASWITSTTVVVDGAQWHSAGNMIVNKSKIRSLLKQQQSSHKARAAKL